MQLADVVDEFFNHLEALILAGDRSQATKRAYEQDLADFLFFVGNRDIKDLSPRDIDLYYIHLGKHISLQTGRPLSKHTMKKRMKAVIRLFNFCIERDYLTASPAAHIHLTASPVDLSAKTIPSGDLQKMLAYAKRKRRNRERDTFIIVALADFGPRRAEIAYLRIPDVHVSKREVLLHRKGRKVQYLPVSGEFIHAYQEWMNVRPAAAHDFVLLSTSDPTHPPLTPEALSQAFRRIAIRATGRSWGPHSVRHRWITNAANNPNISPVVVQQIAGHSSFSMTQRYIKPELVEQRRVVDEFPLLAAADVSSFTAHEDYPAEEDGSVYLDADPSTWFGEL